MEEINENELKAIVVFRKKVEDVLPNEYTRSDDYLIRWLRARNLNQRQAEELLRSNLLWRKEHDLDHILDLPQDAYFLENFPGHHTVTLDGGPLYCVSMKYWDFTRIVADDKIPQFQQYVNSVYETMDVRVRRYNEGRRRPGEKAAGFSLILNWEGFSIFQMTSIKGLQSLLNGFSTMEAHYPETLAHAIFINTNYVFQSLYALLKGILAPKTLAKMAAYGSNRREWEPAVRAIVDGNQIPYEFGGNKSVEEEERVTSEI